jgi:hypothetical protein
MRNALQVLVRRSYQLTMEGALNLSIRRRVENAVDLRIDSFCGPKAVVLAVVPALVDGAMEADEFVLNIRVGEANIDEVICSQGEVLMQAVGATVVLVGCLTADGLGRRFEAIGAGARGAGSVLIVARWVEGATVVGTCPPIMRSVVVGARTGDQGGIRWVWVNGKSPFAWSLGACVVVGACAGAPGKVRWEWVNGRSLFAWGLGAHVNGRRPLTWGLQDRVDQRCV